MHQRSQKLFPWSRALRGALAAAALAAAGCAAQTPATPPAAAGEEDVHDPFENTNRAIFGFNQAVDRHVLVPVAKTYRTVLPGPVRDSLRDFLNNLRSPLILADDALQGDFGAAKNTVARFVLNSTIGMGGLVDVAGRWGIPYHEQDFGITLGVWGIKEGPYLVIPVLGPSDPRDFLGQTAESFADPWNILASQHDLLWVTFLRGGVSGIDQRSRYIETLADIERTSLDYYATIRSLYRQRRAALIHHNRELPPNPSFGAGNRAPPLAVGQSPNLSPRVVSDAPNTLEVAR